MSPAKPISNIHAMTSHLALALLLIGSVLTLACEQAETRTAPVTTSTPSGSSTAPSSAAAATRDEALVRVVHAIPFGSAMDVYAGDLVTFDAVGFKSVTSYRALDGKRYVFSLRPAGMTNAKPLATNTEGLEDGRYYSIFALPGNGRTVHLRIVSDRLDQPANGKSRLRVVHGGDGLDSVEIRATGSGAVLLEGVEFQAVTDYQDVNPFNGGIEVHADRKSVLLLPNAHLEAGRFYTMVIVGSARSSPTLEAFIIEDQLAPTTTR
jgi:hypothetical protein